MFEFNKLPNGMIMLKPLFVKPTDVIKMRSTLKSFVRDWAKEVNYIVINQSIGRRRKEHVLSANHRRNNFLLPLTHKPSNRLKDQCTAPRLRFRPSGI
jgi:hypothetical protein